ncbi:hypothetical protein TWF718_006421 [Orbilia javanica]|uniref:Uncharacterized protein n=1 Tax=Orbilia javanica TaxID=47235 RepID=A0AAN8MTF5_9PEZI
MVQSKFWELHGLSETLHDIIDMVTRTAIFTPGAQGSNQWPSLEASIARSASGITEAGRQTAASAPQSALIANGLADLVRDVPNLRITLRRDTWGDRDGQPYAQNLWDRIKELSDYLTDSGMVNLDSASSLLTWLYAADFDPIVGIYSLDTDKKDELELAAGSITTFLEDVRSEMMEISFAYRGSVSNIQDQQLANDAIGYLQLKLDIIVNDFLADYSGVFGNLRIVIQDVEAANNPRSLGNFLQRVPVPAGGMSTVSVSFGSFGL